MKRFSFYFVLFFSIIFLNTACITDDLEGGLTNDEIIAGLKEALRVGSDNSVTTLNKENGYFADLALKILLPPEAANVESKLRDFGFGYMVDDVILKMNRAAEAAAVKAKPIFINAITNITINDGLNILNGSDNAATIYLQNNTQTQLVAAYKPDIQAAMEEAGAQQAWASVTSKYNSLPLVTPVNTDLSQHVTQKAMDGLFLTIAKEEKKIRQDPVARVTDILKKVFGNQQ